MDNIGKIGTDGKNDEITIDILKLARELFTLRHIMAMIIAGIVLGTAAFIFSKFALTELYTSSVSLYVSNNDVVINLDSIDNQSLTTSRSLAESYVVILKSDEAMRKVGEKLFAKYSANQLSEYFNVYLSSGVYQIKGSEIGKCFSIAPIDETEILNISATTQNPQLSADLCNALAAVAPDFLRQIIGAGSVEPIGEALVPDTKSFPNNTKNTAVGIFLGIFAVAAVIVLRAILDNKIRDAEDFKNRFGLPVLGEIPEVKTDENVQQKPKKSKRKNKADFDKKDGNADFNSFRAAEAFNSFANNLIVTLSMNDEKVVVVSSPNENDGKSFISVNLAKTMANMGNRVLLLDLDLRKGTVHRKLKAANDCGITDVIAKKKSVEECIKKNVSENMDVLFMGRIAPNPSEMLSSKRMSALIEECKERYDFVVIDSPPVNVVVDACIIAQLAAGIVVTVRENSTKYDDARQAIDNIALSNNNIVGFVINGVSDHSQRYGYYKKYGYGYGYYRRSEAAE